MRSDIGKFQFDISHLKRCELKTPDSTNQALCADTEIQNISKSTETK